MKPTLHITNFASRRLHHGRVFSIMVWTPKWAEHAGVVQALMPTQRSLKAYQQGKMLLENYRYEYTLRMGLLLIGGVLSPGRLCVPEDVLEGREAIIVADGDTLCCTCSRDEAEAGRCHRAWAAPFLVRAGWNVILDGVEYKEGEA